MSEEITQRYEQVCGQILNTSRNELYLAMRFFLILLGRMDIPFITTHFSSPNNSRKVGFGSIELIYTVCSTVCFAI